MLLDNVVYHGFEDLEINLTFYLMIQKLWYEIFPDTNQNNDQDEEKINVDCKHENISPEEKSKDKFYTSSQIRKVFNSK